MMHCFWPYCSDRKRCGAYGSCVALSQAGGKSMKTRKRLYLVSDTETGAAIDVVPSAIEAHKLGIEQCGSGQYCIDLLEYFEPATRTEVLQWFGHIALSMERTFPGPEPVPHMQQFADQWPPSRLAEAQRLYNTNRNSELTSFDYQNLRRRSHSELSVTNPPTRYRK